MQQYVEQLADEMQKATDKKAEINAMKIEDDTSIKPIKCVGKINLENIHKLSKIVGFESKSLPDDRFLTDDQTVLLLTKMVGLLDAWNFHIKFPNDNGEEVPPRLRYRAMRETWDFRYDFEGNAIKELSLCRNSLETCPFEGYCNKCAEREIAEYTDSYSKTENQVFIPSIFNYCDRWCERCDFTAKCRNFAMQKEFFEELENNEKPKDEKIEDIEDYLGRTFGPNFGNSESDFPFNSDGYEDDDDDDDNNGFFSPEKKSERHQLSLQTLAYSDSASLWLDSIKSTCKNNFKRWLALGTADYIFAAIDTVNWYHTFIYPKIRRALSGYFELDDDEYAAYDMNGSAKVTLLGIDNSIAAFNFLKRHLKSHLTEMTGLSEQLTVLRNDIEILFPEARSFIRPGFDE